MSEYTISVQQLNTYVRGRLQSDPFLSEVWVEGEVQEITVRRDIAYVTLVDSEASVSCIVFQFSATGLKDVLVSGSRVRVRGDVTLYVRGGRFSIQVREARAVGVGKMLMQLLALQKQLEKAGYFSPERKRSLPPYPQEIAVVTSQKGAALQDILRIAKRRNPAVRIRVYPVTVQGDTAAQSIAQAFRDIEDDRAGDLVIIARGGGSAADLSAFNDPAVVRAVVGCSVPVVSAVGHETDWTFCDMAADVRASTPSAAAELSIPESAQIEKDIRQLIANAQRAVRVIHGRFALQLRAERAGLRSTGLDAKLKSANESVTHFLAQMTGKLRTILGSKRSELETEQQKLAALNPANILASGYAVVLKNGRRVNKAAELHSGDRLELLFTDGTVDVVVPKQTTEDGDEQGTENN